MQTLVQEPETQVQEPETKEQVNPPFRHDVPIMVTIAEEDPVNAGEYSDGSNCLLATALKRCGYSRARVYCDGAVINGYEFTVDGKAEDVGWNRIFRNYMGVVGKQFIFYPKRD